MAGPRLPGEQRAAARRYLGRALALVGWTLVIGNMLMATGLVPLWQPSVPPPAIQAATPTAAPTATSGWSLGSWVAFLAPRATAEPAPTRPASEPPAVSADSD